MKQTIGQKLAKKLKASMSNFDECGNEYPNEQWKFRVSSTIMLDDKEVSGHRLEEILAWHIDKLLGSKRKIGEPAKKKEPLLTTGNLFPR